MKTTERMAADGTPSRGVFGRVRGWIARHRLLTGIGVAAGTGLAIFVLAYFQPQKLFIDQRVNDAPPAAAPAATQLPPTQPAVPSTVASGEFRSLAHRTSGTATIVTLADGSSYVRLEDFSTENGPDLFVYLSPHEGSGSNDDAMARNSISLGKLRGNIGSQNYRIPAGTDLSTYNSVVIWCRRFTTGFGVAPLEL